MDRTKCVNVMNDLHNTFCGVYSSRGNKKEDKLVTKT